MKILLVEPMEKPRVIDIDGSLESMQKIVGGLIQAIYPFDDSEIALVCNEEGKISGLPLNRALRDDEGKKSKAFWDIYVIQLFMGIIVLICYVIYCILLKTTRIDLIMTIFIVASMLDINWFFWGLEKFKLTVVRNFIVKILTLLGVFIFLKSPEDLIKYTFIMAIGMLLSSLMLWPLP